MERAVPSVKWRTTASAACIPPRDSTSPYSMAATVLPTASRTVCSLSSGLGGPIILGCSPLLGCWLPIRAPSASCGRPHTFRHRASYPRLAVSPVLGPSSAVGLAGFFEQLDISHGGPGDERPEGVVFFGAFLFDCFYGDSTGVVVDQPSVEAAPAPEPHGYSLSVPLPRQIPGHERTSPVRLHIYGPPTLIRARSGLRDRSARVDRRSFAGGARSPAPHDF